jgi:hypothetical protein
MNFLGSPLWGGIGVFVAIVLGVIATVLTLIQIRKARTRKLLAYNVVSNAPIVTVNKEVENRVKVLLDGNTIEDARIVVIEVLNAGDVPIQATDYESPVTFDFGTGAEVLNVDVLQTKPDSIKSSFTLKSGQVSLVPLLLNSQDSITFKALLTKSKGEVKVQGRISGVKEINSFHNLPQSIMKRRWIKVLHTNMNISIFSLIICIYFISFLGDSKGSLYINGGNGIFVLILFFLYFVFSSVFWAIATSRP